MFNPAEETDKDWDLELRDDVKSECQDKYGAVAEIHVDKESSVGVLAHFIPALADKSVHVGWGDLCPLCFA